MPITQEINKIEKEGFPLRVYDTPGLELGGQNSMNDNHESEIYSLYEFRQEDNTRVKSTAAFDKQYLEGRYGADQYVAYEWMKTAENF